MAGMAILTSIDRGMPRDNENPELILAELKHVEPKLTELTYIMRADLGVEARADLHRICRVQSRLVRLDYAANSV
jgi:hypothetical protein